MLIRPLQYVLHSQLELSASCVGRLRTKAQYFRLLTAFPMSAGLLVGMHIWSPTIETYDPTHSVIRLASGRQVPRPRAKFPCHPLTEAAVAHGAMSLGLCPTPEYALVYLAICPRILLDKILTNVGRFRVRGWRSPTMTVSWRPVGHPQGALVWEWRWYGASNSLTGPQNSAAGFA
jgi:hypothetical protein